MGEDSYIVGETIRNKDLAKGMRVQAWYRQHNEGVEYYEILGVTDDDVKYGEGGVKFDSVRAALEAKGFTTLAGYEKAYKARMRDQDGKFIESEYGKELYLVVKDLESGEEGAWFYLYHGKWARGSGAETLHWNEIEKVEPAVTPEPAEDEQLAGTGAGDMDDHTRLPEQPVPDAQAHESKADKKFKNMISEVTRWSGIRIDG